MARMFDIIEHWKSNKSDLVLICLKEISLFDDIQQVSRERLLLDAMIISSMIYDHHRSWLSFVNSRNLKQERERKWSYRIHPNNHYDYYHHTNRSNYKKKRSHLMIGDDYETTKTNLFISFVRNKQIEDLDCFEYNKR